MHSSDEVMKLRPLQINHETMRVLIFFGSVVMAVAYVGNLVAMTTEPGNQEPIDTINKIIDSKIPVGMYNYGGATTIAFRRLTNPKLCDIWSEREWVTSFDAAYQKTIKGLESFSKIVRSLHNDFILVGEMVFMDYRESLRGAVETTYTDELGRPKLKLVEYGVYRQLFYSPFPTISTQVTVSNFQNCLRTGLPTVQHVCRDIQSGNNGGGHDWPCRLLAQEGTV